ncbi:MULTISPECIES: glycerophosphodiester phosphodiesterase family protein [Aquincola]|uniref:glycerophosphodiester phosphodiesterase family protein n=1 Tax=Aquincola TaxID=391952 RepID=UPI000697D2A4|nr:MULTISPECIES: glycerophosphodiester phosphodiesterase family protein [Aquincola]MCR5866546.1 PEP-CTERM sorting domain-containing protein [Aquincola sp. J276]
MSMNLKGAVLALAAAASLAAPFAAQAALKTLDGKAPLVIAHRGASGYLPEHTLGGYELAIKMGADYIEPDLQLTKDGQLVAMHDTSLARTTNVEQVLGQRNGGYRVGDYTLAEIKTLTVNPSGGLSSTTYPGFNPSAAEPYRVPTFQEVIDFTKQQSALAGREIGIYPEVKTAGLEIETKVLDTLVANGYKTGDKVFIQSFNASSIQNINTRQTQLGYDFQLVVLGSANAIGTLGLANIAQYADGVGVSIGSAGMGESFIAAAHAANLKVHGYTFSKFDDTANAQYLEWYGYGIDGVFSNYTDKALAARTEFLAAQVPEPGTWAMFGLGIAGLAVFARRRQQAAA